MSGHADLAARAVDAAAAATEAVTTGKPVTIGHVSALTAVIHDLIEALDRTDRAQAADELLVRALGPQPRVGATQ